MQRFNKVVALLLCMVMLIGFMPVSARAVEDGTVYVLAGSDYQKSGTEPRDNVSNILNRIKADYPTADGFLFGGDYTGNTESTSSTQSGKNELQSVVQSIYGTGMHEIYVQGNHDPDGSVTNGTLSPSGANDTEDYGVYVINEQDYMWHNSDKDTIQRTAQNLKSYLNAKRNAGYAKPIFVITHLPLHYSKRTDDGDAMHANYIFNVLNEAGEAGLNIIFLFGHNHSSGYDNHLGGGSIFLTPGSKIQIAQNSKTVIREETLAFTYMNTGYVGYVSSSNTADDALTMTAFAITDTDVTISRYDAQGPHNLKAAGLSSGDDKYAVNSEVVGSPYTMTLNTDITPAGEEVEAPDSGSTERTYTRVTSISELVSGDQYLIFVDGSSTDYFMLPQRKEVDNRIGFDMESLAVGGNTITGDYQDNEWTMTSVGDRWVLSTASGSVYFEAESDDSRAYATLDPANATEFTVSGSGLFNFVAEPYFLYRSTTSNAIFGKEIGTADLTNFYIYRLTDAGSGMPTVGESNKGDVLVTPGTPATEDGYRYTLDVDGTVDDGAPHLIVSSSTANAMTADGTSLDDVVVTITGETAYVESQAHEWTISADGVISNGTYYLQFAGNSDASGGSLNLVTSQSTATSWKISDAGDGEYQVSVVHVYKHKNGKKDVEETCYLYYSSSNAAFTWSIDAKTVRMYDEPVFEAGKPAMPNLYAHIVGGLVYDVEMGTSAADALAQVKDGIDVELSLGGTEWESLDDEDPNITWTLSRYDSTAPGEYAVTISYQGKVLGVAKVVIPPVAIVGYDVEPEEGTVNKGASQAAKTGALIRVELENGQFYTVPVTVAMLTKADGSRVSTGEVGTIEGLKLTYNGVVITENFTLHIAAKTGNNYPEYPYEGAVKVNKTGTGIDFQSSGIAQVELSASGIPVKKGADVIVMLDLSSSMTNTVSGTNKSRRDIMEESLVVLMEQLKKTGEDGELMDIRLAVADFNRYYPDEDSPYYINSDDHMNGTSIRTNDDGLNYVYTGSGRLDAGAFVNVSELATTEFDDFGYNSGTNYDYAFDAIYQLGEAITTANIDAGEERDLFVIFMTDGVPYQFNYFGSNTSSNWNHWMDGTMTDDMFGANSNRSYYNEEGKHWMAEAIKGDPDSTYPVIRKNDPNDTDGDTWVDVNGLGAKMYSVGFCVKGEGDVTLNTIQTVLGNIATEGYFYTADTADQLTDAFKTITGDIAYAAYNARFVDQMGDDYDLQMKTSTYEVVEDDVTVTKTLAPQIEIISYDIYTRQDYLNGECSESKIGDRKGTYAVLETVTFTDDGEGNVTGAYSSLIDNGQTNILADGTQAGYVKGVIYAKTFLYNTNATGVAIDGVSIPTGSTNVLPAETFYWKMGTVQTSELAMRYYVYLEGSREGTREGGSYPTNEYATLYYDNYLENPCFKDTVSPVMPWEEANVSYAFYLVNENGEIIVNQTTGQTGSFANKIAVTNPVVYETVKLNNDEEISSINIASLGVLPEGYTLYDFDGTNGATYTITINSNTTGGWEISTVKNVQTTYVTQYDPKDPSAYTNALSNSAVGDDYTHTVVWFAVLWKVQALPDTVVIDYGLPVDISVLANDMFGENGKLAAIGANSTSLNLDGYDTNLADGFGRTYTGTYGSASIDEENGKVRYQIADMQMDGYERFAYAVNYTGTANRGYYYDTVTVIPATTIYYEESFVDFAIYENRSPFDMLNDDWDNEGRQADGITQAEDRPGFFSLSSTDANNLYGYDGAYSECSMYSLGAAKKVKVNANQFAEAIFTFKGTGFDVISMTSNTTGTITVELYDPDQFWNANNEATYQGRLATHLVDTYYGYSYENGEWKPVGADPNALYQVPVMSIEGLEYDKYTVVITAAYGSIFDHDQYGDGSYDFYLDAIRIYDPANDGSGNDVIEQAYKADNEGWPAYTELRNLLITAEDFNAAWEAESEVPGIIFIDSDADLGDGDTVTGSVVEDYKNFGPNNELYLAPGQAVAFRLNAGVWDDEGKLDKNNIASVQIGLKSVGIGANSKTVAKARIGDTTTSVEDMREKTVATATDMYYDITDLNGKVVVIKNNGGEGDPILSITNLKVTFKKNPQADDLDLSEMLSNVATVSKPVMMMAVFSLRSAPVQEPEATEPEETEPTEPEETVPEIFVPELIQVELNKDSIRVGQKVQVTVTTSDDVDYVVINGMVISAKGNGKKDFRTWKTSVTANEAGTMDVNVVCYDEAGVASAVVTQQITVQNKKG